jgi:predicted PurR-regulated permease PerM
MNHDSQHPQSRITLVTFLTVLLLVLGVTTRMIWPYCLAVFTGGILALLSSGFYQKLNRRLEKPKISATLITLGLALLVIVPLVLFMHVAVRQGIVLGKELGENNSYSFHEIFNRIGNLKLVQMIIGDPETLKNQARTWVQGAGKGVTSEILSLATNIPKILLQVALALIACFFFLLDGKKFLIWTENKIPLDHDVRKKMRDSFQSTAISVIWATLAAATAQALMMFISYFVLDVPSAFLATGATFIFAWIPLIGCVPVWLVGALYLYLKGSMVKMVLMILLGLVTGVVDNIVRPLVLKGRGTMHPFVSLIAIIGGVGMFGIMGVFIGPILMAVLISLLQIWPAVGFRFGLLPHPSEITQGKIIISVEGDT